MLPSTFAKHSRCVSCSRVREQLPKPPLHRGTLVGWEDFKKRILVTTDLFGRGMDVERVNIVIQYDMPQDKLPVLSLADCCRMVGFGPAS